MVSREPKNERPLCEAVMRVLAQRTGEEIVSVQHVDSAVRDRPAVELIFDTRTQKFAIEHTRIESFANQIAEGKRFAHLLKSLETELAGKLPGVFFLIVDLGAARVPAAQHDEVRRALADWILTVASSLEPEEKVGTEGNCDITATPPGVSVKVTLHRDCDYDSGLLIIQNRLGAVAAPQRERVREALARKCPKLAAEKAKGAASVLILESDDIALANRVAIADAVVAELADRSDAPDIVLWARTSTRPWKGSFIKDGANYPDVRSAKLFGLER